MRLCCFWWTGMSWWYFTISKPLHSTNMNSCSKEFHADWDFKLAAILHKGTKHSYRLWHDMKHGGGIVMVWAALLPSLSIIKGTINSKLQQEVLKAPEYPDRLLVKSSYSHLFMLAMTAQVATVVVPKDKRCYWNRHINADIGEEIKTGCQSPALTISVAWPRTVKLSPKSDKQLQEPLLKELLGVTKGSLKLLQSILWVITQRWGLNHRCF